MKYEIWQNGKCVTATNDFRAAIVGYHELVSRLQSLDTNALDNFCEDIELRLIEEKRKIRFTFSVEDLK